MTEIKRETGWRGGMQNICSQIPLYSNYHGNQEKGKASRPRGLGKREGFNHGQIRLCIPKEGDLLRGKKKEDWCTTKRSFTRIPWAGLW
jgi:hypothetical protein